LDLLHGLRLKHLGCRGLLALVDLAVLANLAAVIPEFEKTQEDCDYDSTCQYLNDVVSDWSLCRLLVQPLTKVIFCHNAHELKNSPLSDCPKAILEVVVMRD
jgi:hypothetical protein